MGKRIAVVGATGTVGREVLQELAARGVDVAEVAALASERSIGVGLSYGEDAEIRTDDLAGYDFAGTGAAIFCTAPAVSAANVPRAAKAGVWTIDTSSHFRLDHDVPVIVAGVNDDAPTLARAKRRIVAVPGACVTMLVQVLSPLHKAANVRRAIVSTYQCVSEMGKAAMDELFGQTRNVFVNQPMERTHFAKQIAFNVIPQCGGFEKDGHTTDERALATEVRKILASDTGVFATCVRVPTFVGHGISAVVEFAEPMGVAQARSMLARAEGIAVVDHRSDEGFVTPLETQGEQKIYVSRLRDDPSVPNGLAMWIAADNLRTASSAPIADLAIRLADNG
ncbi:MAG: aspartate-semialdehyde dehydrogenase [Alphaproteobacteria bacterium]|nr:aspartate-semialdehyde dehydrogenase [Alphaproteobacteria bacterium]